MALLHCDFFSETLGLATSMTVILPQPVPDRPADSVPVLYLLHGLSDDDTMWTRRTSLERYVEPLGLAVVMPQVHKSFYTDEVSGLPFWRFLTEELPSVVHGFFRLSSRREDTFVAGLSMGGYGALKWALREPWRFAAAASLSGALALSHPSEQADPEFARIMGRVFGDGPTDGTQDDVIHLARTIDRSTCPDLYVACGTEDFLYPSNEWFVEQARTAQLPLTVDFGPGDHDWAYWDAKIEHVVGWLPLTCHL